MNVGAVREPPAEIETSNCRAGSLKDCPPRSTRVPRHPGMRANRRLATLRACQPYNFKRAQPLPTAEVLAEDPPVAGKGYGGTLAAERNNLLSSYRCAVA